MSEENKRKDYCVGKGCERKLSQAHNRYEKFGNYCRKCMGKVSKVKTRRTPETNVMGYEERKERAEMFK